MGIIYFFLMIVTFISVWSFFNFMPKYAEERALSIINNSILAVAVIVCVAFFIKIYVSMQGTINDGWWKPVAVCGSMLIISGFTFFGMLIRNFWIFKAPKRPGGF